MKSKRQRKNPVTSSRPKNAVSHRATQATISTFHTLIKRQAILKRQLARPSSADHHQELAKDLHQIEAELQALGGLEAYQAASKFGQSTERGGDSAKVLIHWLKSKSQSIQLEPEDQPSSIPRRRLRMLELGALTPDNYSGCKNWLDNTPIDLHSQHPRILEQDFFARPMPTDDTERFNIVSCSLVLNFVPEPLERGRMLTLIHDHLRPHDNSLLFLVLPTPCIRNSRYISPATLISLMRNVGFELLEERYKPGGKVTYWLWGWRERPKLGDEKYDKKVLENEGAGRNNFAIVLP